MAGRPTTTRFVANFPGLLVLKLTVVVKVLRSCGMDANYMIVNRKNINIKFCDFYHPEKYISKKHIFSSVGPAIFPMATWVAR